MVLITRNRQPKTGSLATALDGVVTGMEPAAVIEAPSKTAHPDVAPVRYMSSSRLVKATAHDVNWISAEHRAGSCTAQLFCEFGTGKPTGPESFTTSLKTAFLAQRRKDAKKKQAWKNNGLEMW